MKRREFIVQGTTGALAAGLAGCATRGREPLRVKQELTLIDLDKKVSRPKGTMPMGELGKTGIKVSKFGFGSHMREDMVKYTKEREWMVREALDLGVNLFDVYDEESGAFQYEPMGRYLEPVKNQAVISITMYPNKGLTVEQEFENDLRVFRRDYIDMVRLHAWKRPRNQKELDDQQGHKWEWWETLFKYKEKGLIRAVGVSFHRREDIKQPLAELPLDFAILPYNFYHNWTWAAMPPDTVQTLIPAIRKKGIGVICMKPFAGDHLVIPFSRLAAQYDESRTVNFPQACLRHVINSGLDFDTTLVGMFNPYHVYEDIAAYFSPQMSDEERKVLTEIRGSVHGITADLLPPHYQFLEEWA
ncbi:MAG: aldo/keto reductase [Candidatus Latescibacter sp.]|nr:aldo/keto reductase [Candidatus Latescibacter sp.]